MSYSKDIYSKALSILQNRRSKAQAELVKRKEYIYNINNHAKQIHMQLGSTAVKLAKAVLNGNDVSSNVKRLKEENLKFQKELQEILSANNLPSDYLDVKYRCEKCSDTGFIDGKMCNCLKDILKKQTYDQLNKVSPLDLSSFDDFSLDYYSDTPQAESSIVPKKRMQKIFDYCFSYAEKFRKNSPTLLMQGNTGLGKTHLSLAIAKTVIEKGYAVIYSSAPALLTKLEREHFSKNIDDDTLNHLLDCDLLILDDLGTEFETKFTAATIYNILNSRMLSSKPTIISTNLSLTDLEQAYTGRFVSRIIGNSHRLEFLGKDIRQQLKCKRKNRGV